MLVKEYLKANPSVLDLYEQVIKTALYEVGKLWENNKISVATEHMATAISEGILNELFELIITDKKFNHKVVVACVENELHQVGVKMVADVFEMHGWESYFLGTGIPLNELIRYISEVKPDILAISLSIYFNFTNLIKMVNEIKKIFPTLTIIIGGQAFSSSNKELPEQLKDTLLIPDLYLLKQFIKTINKTN
jgi:methanogenic corrinoid protein MtbC1